MSRVVPPASVDTVAAVTARWNTAVPVESTVRSPSAVVPPRAAEAVMFPLPELRVSFCAPSSCFSMFKAPPPVWISVSWSNPKFSFTESAPVPSARPKVSLLNPARLIAWSLLWVRSSCPDTLVVPLKVMFVAGVPAPSCRPRVPVIPPAPPLRSISLANSARSFAPAASVSETVRVPPASSVPPLSSSTDSENVWLPVVHTVTAGPPREPITVF